MSFAINYSTAFLQKKNPFSERCHRFNEHLQNCEDILSKNPESEPCMYDKKKGIGFYPFFDVREKDGLKFFILSGNKLFFLLIF